MTIGLASLQVAAYGGKLRYTLSYTAAGQGSPLSDPDVQITVSTWIPVPWAPSVSFQPSTQPAWHELEG